MGSLHQEKIFHRCHFSVKWMPLSGVQNEVDGNRNAKCGWDCRTHYSSNILFNQDMHAQRCMIEDQSSMYL